MADRSGDKSLPTQISELWRLVLAYFRQETVELDADPAVAAYQAAAVAPLGPFDRQRLLEQDGPDERLTLLASALADEVRVLAQRASWG